MHCRKSTIAALMTFCLAHSSPALAQTSTGSGPSDTEVSVAELGNVRPLSLNEAIALGVSNNLDVEVSRYQPYIAQLSSEAAWGAYDPLFEGNVTYYDEEEPATSFTSGTDPRSIQEQFGGDAGVTALIPYVGASVNLGYDSTRQDTNLIFASLAPAYDSGLTIGANVPLMRGLIWNEPWTQVKLTRLSYDADLDDFTTSIMDITQGIIDAYWGLVATKEQVRVAVKSLESNQPLLDQTKTQYQVGVVSKVEVVQAEAGVANSEFQLIVARNDYRNAQDRLISAVLGDRLRADTTLTFDPTDNPDFQQIPSVDLNQAVETAFTKRPELAAAKKRIEQGEVQLRFAKNQRLPQLDVNVQYRTLGIAGRPNPVGLNPPFPNVVGDWADSNEGWFGDNHGITAMGIVSVPLGNTRGRKNVSKARIELRRANSQVTRLRQQIIVEVRRAARGLLAAAQGVEAAERRRVAAEEQLRAETIRLEHGESTPFDVLQRDRDLVEAESQKIEALRAYRVSAATLEREQGTILDDRKISIEKVRKLAPQ